MSKGAKIGLALLLAVGMAGCSSKKSKEEVQKEVTQKIMSFGKYGFDVNKSKDSFVLTVKDKKLVAQEILTLFNQQLLMSEDRRPLEELVDHEKFGVKVDWEKYAEHAKDSVFVYYLGDGNVSAELQDFLNGKNLGAYLTFDEKDELKTAKIKEIDKTLNDSHIVYKNAQVNIDKFAHNYKEPRKFDIDFGQLNIEEVKTKEKMTLDGGKCTIDQSNAYLGDAECTINKLMFALKELDTKFEVSDIVFRSNTKDKSGKVVSNADFTIGNIQFEGKKNPTQPKATKFDIDNLKLNMGVSNIDRSVFDHMYSVLDKNISNEKKSEELFGDIVKLFTSGAKWSGKLYIDTVGTEDNISDVIAIKGFSSDFEGLFDKVIDLSSHSTVESFHLVSKHPGKQADITVNNFKFGYTIGKLYNYFPELFNAMPKDGSGDIDDKAMDEIMQKMVNNGLKLGIGTVGFDSMKVNIPTNQMELGKLVLDIDSTLKENKLDMSNPMSQQLILQYLSANGKMVLKKKDFDQLIKFFPPSVGMMVSLFVKESGDDAVFELKFEDDHLTVNGKKVM